MTTAIGLLAGLLTTGAWLPQIHRSWRMRSCEGLSWGYLTAMVVGFATWLVYGVLADATAVVVTNTLSLGLAAALVGLKLHTHVSPPVGYDAAEVVPAGGR
jgi:MtN3 and saliva related transmembrane protein